MGAEAAARRRRFVPAPISPRLGVVEAPHGPCTSRWKSRNVRASELEGEHSRTCSVGVNSGRYPGNDEENAGPGSMVRRDQAGEKLLLEVNVAGSQELLEPTHPLESRLPSGADRFCRGAAETELVIS